MTSWEDQQMRGGAGRTAVGPSSGQPMSRREAREAERRAAEAVAERQPHPSGVVDFEAHDFGSDFAPDQAFDVGDTQDIWAALTRGQRPGGDDLGRFRSGVPEEAPAGRDDAGSVSGELLDRVRDAVLRRSAEPQRPAPQQPAAFTPAPQQPVPTDGASRRQRRERETADLREDGLPNELFADPRRAPKSGPTRTAPTFPAASEPEQQLPAPQRRSMYEQQQPVYDQQPVYEQQPVYDQQPVDDYDEYDDGYYDEPYAPEPTRAIPLAPMDLETPSPTTSPVSLPQSFAEPAGDDALTFSSPLPTVPADARDEWPAAQADPSFLAPEEPWEAQQAVPQPRAAHPASPFLAPQQDFHGPELGPPSEVTDLAGFEALIRKARQQPPAPQPAAPTPSALAWADDEDVQEGFTGLLSRGVQGGHGSANALIVPHDGSPDLTQALDSNGDIFITGSMNLSRSLSTTGAASELYDSEDIDRLYEASQDEPAAGVAPVRASRAVSGASQDRHLVKARGRRGNVLPTVLAIVASVMAVGVVTLLVGSWVLRIF